MNKKAREAAFRYAEKLKEFGQRMVEIAEDIELQVEESSNLLKEIKKLDEDVKNDETPQN